MKIAITGATGSLGGALIAALAHRTDVARIVGLSRDEVKSGDLAERYADLPSLRCVLGDVRDERRLEEVFYGCDTVVHAAALKKITQSVYSPSELVATNVQGTINVVRAAINAHVEKVMFVSSDKACVAGGTPIVLEDGHNLAIAPIVRDKLPVRVRSLSLDGRTLVEREVNGWHRNQRGGRAMFRLTYEGAAQREGKDQGVLLTGDHRVLTVNGWREVDAIKSGEMLVTAEPSLNSRTERMVAPAIVAPANFADQEVYCLGVTETENFISGGLILHNCEATNLYGMTKAVAECYAVQSNSYAVPRGCRISAVRYGNVLLSRGSVVNIWRDQINRGVPLTITDPRMTRFLLTLPQAAHFILAAIDTMEAGAIYVPDLPAATMLDLATAVGGNHPQKIIGLRPGGEKLTEVLLSDEEVPRTLSDGQGRYTIMPSHRSWDTVPYQGHAVPSNLHLSSETARRLTIVELRGLFA